MKVRDILTNYLEQNHRRKSPERYAVLEAVYGMNGRFTLDELSDTMEKDNFRVSRATLYSSMKLFIELKLVVRHSSISNTLYEACYAAESHLYQVCTDCGKVTEIVLPEIVKAFNTAKYVRFHKDGFTAYIYGVCSVCQIRQARQRNKKIKQTTNKQ